MILVMPELEADLAFAEVDAVQKIDQVFFRKFFAAIVLRVSLDFACKPQDRCRLYRFSHYSVSFFIRLFV